MKRYSTLLTVFIALCMIFVFSGCKKKEEQPMPKTGSPMAQGPMTQPMGDAANPHGAGGPKTEKKIVIPDSVKGKWGKVVLTLEDKSSKKTTDYTINVKSEFSVPNTTLKIVVGDFLPEFKMDEATITSGSNEPNNPAAQVEIFDSGKSVFKGWLFSKFPTMHPFEHPKYGITLKEGLKG